MCIGHLGHLHHTLTDQQIAQIGQLDVVMVPVDGSYTMDTCRHGRGAEGPARAPDPAHALLQSLHAQPLPRAHRAPTSPSRRRASRPSSSRRRRCRASPRCWCCRGISLARAPVLRRIAGDPGLWKMAAIPPAVLLAAAKRVGLGRMRSLLALARAAPLLIRYRNALSPVAARLPADGAGHRHVRGHAHGHPLHDPASAGRRGRLLPQRVRPGGDPAPARAPRSQPVLHRAARPARAARRAQRVLDAGLLRRPVADAAGAGHRALLHRPAVHRAPQRALPRRGVPLAALDGHRRAASSARS